MFRYNPNTGFSTSIFKNKPAPHKLVLRVRPRLDKMILAVLFIFNKHQNALFKV